jgi:hypothetical protein
MAKAPLRIVLMALVLCVGPQMALADCVEDPRTVSLDNGNVLRIKSYLCSIGKDDNSSKLRIEFHRLSAIAARLAFAPTPSNYIKQLMGDPHIVKNDVFNELSYISQHFGINQDTNTTPSLYIFVDAKAGHLLGGPTPPKRFEIHGVIPTIFGSEQTPAVDIPYPALKDFSELQKKHIPDNVYFFYYPKCDDLNSSSECMMFWRGMTVEDINSYTSNVMSYNNLIKKIARSDIDYRVLKLNQVVPGYLPLVKYLAGDQKLPADFVPMITDSRRTSPPASEIECGGVGVGGQEWKYDAIPRSMTIDAVLIANVSGNPISIDALIGERVAGPRLRPSSASEFTGAQGSLDMSTTLAPGAEIIVPVKLEFGFRNLSSRRDNYKLDDLLRFHRESDKIAKRLGSNGYVNSADKYRFPAFVDYTFGPEWRVSGVVANSNRIEIAKRAASFTDVAFVETEGSCPYLMSFDPSLRDWVMYGKILHSASEESLETTQTVAFSGFRSRFRLEEREPEIAFIDHAELQVNFGDGRSISLNPRNTGQKTEGSRSFRLFWGEATELVFQLPHGIEADKVVQSRLVVTGYYRRYSAIPGLARAGEEALSRAPYSPISRWARPVAAVSTGEAGRRAGAGVADIVNQP